MAPCGILYTWDPSGEVSLCCPQQFSSRSLSQWVSNLAPCLLPWHIVYLCLPLLCENWLLGQGYNYIGKALQSQETPPRKWEWSPYWIYLTEDPGSCCGTEQLQAAHSASQTWFAPLVSSPFSEPSHYFPSTCKNSHCKYTSQCSLYIPQNTVSGLNNWRWPWADHSCSSVCHHLPSSLECGCSQCWTTTLTATKEPPTAWLQHGPHQLEQNKHRNSWGLRC